MQSFRNLILVFLCSLLFVAQAYSQTAGAPLAPADRAMTFTAAEIEQAARSLAEQGIFTRRLLEGGIFSVNVRHLEGAETALQHGRITEVWVIQDGSGIIVTGGTILDAQPGAGPGDFSGSGIQAGVEREIKAGDVVYIPTGLPHGIKETNSITYLNIRFELRDPD